MPINRIHNVLPMVLVVLFFAGCVSAPPPTPDGPDGQPDPGVTLIQQAEAHFQRGDMEMALNRFSMYLRQYPDGPRAALALSRIGDIYMTLEIYDAARAFYHRLLTEFPNSDFAVPAQLAIIDSLILDNQLEAAAIRSRQLADAELTASDRRKVLQRLEQIAEASGRPADAALYAYLLFESAEDQDKASLAERFAQLVEQLESDALEMLWDRVTEPFAKSLIMYRYAVVQAVLENYDEALEIFIAFRDSYPAHAFAETAAQIIDSLEQRLRFTPQTLGCLLPLSGPYKLYGRRVLNGVELALNLFSTGEQPVPIRLVIEDSEADDTASIEGVRRLVNAGAGVILGPIVSAPAAVSEAQRLHIPMVTITQKQDIASAGDFIFRHFITPQGQVKALASYFINEVGLRDFGVLYPNETYGRTFMQLFLDEIAIQGGRLTAVESYDTAQTDFAESIRKLVGLHYQIPAELERRSAVRLEDAPYFQTGVAVGSALDDLLPDPMTRLTGLFFQDPDQDRVRGPAIGRKHNQEVFNPIVDFDVLFIPDAPKTAGLILPQLAYHDIKDVYLAGTNLWHSSQLIEMSRQYAQNAIMPDGFFKDDPSPVVRQFVTAYQDIYGTEPGIIEAFAFDTAWILFNILARPDMQFRHILRDSLLEAYETSGVTGPTAFDGNGEAVKNLSLMRINGSRFIEIQQ